VVTRGFILLACMASLGAGCGYSLGVRSPPGVETVAVPIFNNATFPLRRDVEYEVTSALRKEIQTRTPLRLVSSEQADLVVHGTVAEFDEWVVAEGRQDEKVESNLRITVDLIVEDYRNRVRRDIRVQDVEPFSVASGETIDVARLQAVGNLAEKIVQALEEW
jgi:hypothetical protein